RHTRFSRDWSSDVCSSDLGIADLLDDALGADKPLRAAEAAEGGVGDGIGLDRLRGQQDIRIVIGVVGMEKRAVGNRPGKVRGERSEERRVGKESMSRWERY